MGLQTTNGNLSRLINGLKDRRNWVNEINDLSSLISEIEGLGKATSVRDLATIICKSKSWVGVSLILLRGLKLYPEIEKFSNRNKAYLYVKRKQKFRRFIES